MEDNQDGQIERSGSLPNHVTAPALRNVKNALLAGGSLEVVRDELKVRVGNGSDQHSNTTQKEQFFQYMLLPPGI